MRRGLRRLAAMSASGAAALLLIAFVWQIWLSWRDDGSRFSPSQAGPPRTPATTIWHKADAVSMGFASADDIVVDNDTVFFLAGNNNTPVVTAVEADSGRTAAADSLAGKRPGFAKPVPTILDESPTG
ncbi:MAG TPA: hypothetical protein VJJ98_09580 [Sedimentisphaerales bacterium]|nr:hypothetical protein [Sedimentisphaerales bacterium]